MSQFDAFLATRRRLAAERDMARTVAVKKRDEPAVLEPVELEEAATAFAKRVDNYKFFLLLLALDAVMALLVLFVEHFGDAMARRSDVYRAFLQAALAKVVWAAGYAQYATWLISFAEVVLTLQDAVKSRSLRLLLALDMAVVGGLAYALYPPAKMGGAWAWAAVHI